MNKALRTILIIAVLAAFLSTISYCSAPFDTETAQTITIKKTINGNGYILRSETPVLQSANGVFEPGISNGVRVSKGSQLGVAISGNLNRDLASKLADITKRIEEIKKSDNFSDLYASDEARLFSALKDISATIRDNIHNENFSDAADNTGQLNTILENKYSSQNGAADQLLISLEQERYELEAQLGGIREEVTSPASGYFYTTLDGLESVGSETDIVALTASQVDAFADTLTKYEPDNTYIAKIVDTYTWYLAATVDKSEAELIAAGDEISLSVDDDSPVTATVLAVNTEENSENAAIIIKCNRSTSGIYEKRSVEFEICYEQYSGLYVPSAAIRIVDDITGVYVISRNETVAFKCVDVILKEQNYYIVRSNYIPPEDVKYPALKIYDDILVNPEAVKIDEPEK